MSQLLKKQVFGEIPKDFDALLVKACEFRPEKKTLRRPVRALVIALIIVLFAGTALAVTRGLNIISWFGVGHVNERDAERVIDTIIEQTGGTTSIANFEVTEAFYDGTFLRFIVTSSVNQEAVLRNAAFSILHEGDETADLPGQRYGVTAQMHSPDEEKFRFTSVSMWHIDQSLCLFENSFLKEGETSPESIDITLDIVLSDIDDGSEIEHTTLAFTVRQTATPLTEAYDLGMDLDYIRLEKVTIAKTPLEIIASVEYRPLLKAFELAILTVVPEDGYVVKNDRPYYFGATGTMAGMADGKTTMNYTLPVEQADDGALTLWIPNTDRAVRLDLATGEAKAIRVAVIQEGNDVKIEKVED